MKQTAVEWLNREIRLNSKIKENSKGAISFTLGLSKFDELFKQAKEMEKEQKGYSEEDLKEAFKQVRYCIIFEDTQFEDWLEKFKNRII